MVAGSVSQLPEGVPDLGVESRAGWETVTVLITVKAYPVIGQKTGESVCVAGARLDGPRPEWIRLFPVPFRELPAGRQFRKYAIVQVRAQRGKGSDRRPESLRPDLGSLQVGPVISTERDWRARWSLIGSLAGEVTTCQLAEAARDAGQAAPSLGLVRPVEVLDVEARGNPDYQSSTGVAEIPDVDLFGTERRPLEATPFILKYRYRCADCRPGRMHTQTIIDWEAGQLSRRLLREGRSPGEAMEEARTKFLEIADGKKDAHFYVGNQHMHPASFLVLGVFWPPAGSRPADRLF